MLHKTEPGDRCLLSCKSIYPVAFMLSSSSPQAVCPQSSQQAIVLHRITSGTVWAIAPETKGGLLLVKPFYVDFAGPGAAVGGKFDQDCVAVYAVGQVRLQPILTQGDRAAAIHTRRTYAAQLAAILDMPQATQRGHCILSQLATWLPGNLALTIPAELTASLAGVLPRTIQQAWQSPKAFAADLPLSAHCPPIPA